jgi:hypothetical protein
MEVRLLALERRLVHIDDQLRQHQRQITGIGQGIWDAWSDVHIPAATPTPTPTGTFPACCPGYTFPATVTLVDNVYGNFTLTFDGTSTYSGCKSINFAGSLFCGAVNPMSLYYTVVVDGTNCLATLTMKYYGQTAGSHCPTSGHTCADTAPNRSFSAATSLPCSGGTMTWNLNSDNGPHPSGSSPQQKITLP